MPERVEEGYCPTADTANANANANALSEAYKKLNTTTENTHDHWLEP